MINTSGRWRSTLVGMGAVLGVGLGCTKNVARVDAARGINTPSTAETTLPLDFGKAKTRLPCRPKWTFLIPCLNFSRRDFNNVAMHERLARFLRKFNDNHRFSDPTLPIERDVKDGHATALHMLREIRDPTEIQFRGNTKGSVVMARFDVYKSSGTDLRYGITPDPNGEDWQHFFLVVKLGKPEQFAVNEGHQFGTWSIYRIAKGAQGGKDVIERVGNSGSYRWCVVPLERVAYEYSAQFISCSTAHALQLIEQGKDISHVLQEKHASLLTAVQQELGVAVAMSADAPEVETALRKMLNLRNSSDEEFHRVVSREQVSIIVKALHDARTAPAWMLCGVGSCTADEPG